MPTPKTPKGAIISLKGLSDFIQESEDLMLFVVDRKGQITKVKWRQQHFSVHFSLHKNNGSIRKHPLPVAYFTVAQICSGQQKYALFANYWHALAYSKKKHQENLKLLGQ